MNELHLRDSKKPLSKDILSQLPLRKYVAAENEEEDKDNKSQNDDSKNCRVCMCDFENGEEILTLHCFHIFHTECIGNWFKTQDWCPICRTKIGENPDAVANFVDD